MYFCSTITSQITDDAKPNSDNLTSLCPPLSVVASQTATRNTSNVHGINTNRLGTARRHPAEHRRARLLEILRGQPTHAQNTANINQPRTTH